MTADFQRPLLPGKAFDHLFPAPDNQDTTLMQNGDLEDTVQLMARYIKKYRTDTASIAPLLKAGTLEETLRNDWEFVYNHIQYQIDTPGLEQLRRPARSWKERRTGVDCDCYSIFLATLLLNQGIIPVIRVVRIAPATRFHHVYVIVPDNGDYYTLDCVLDEFNYEKPFTAKKDYTMERLGIPIIGLHGLSGDDPVLTSLVKTRDFIKAYPNAVEPYEDSGRFLEELEYAIQHWNTPNRDKALEALASREKELNRPLLGLGDVMTGELPASCLAALGDIYEAFINGFDSVLTVDDLGRGLLKKEDLMKKRFARWKKAPGKNFLRKKALANKLVETVRRVDRFGPADKQKAVDIIREQSEEMEPAEDDPRSEAIEDYIERIEDMEDDMDNLEVEEMEGIGSIASLGLFNRKKRLEKKEKRLEKKKAKAEAKGDTRKVETLQKRIEKADLKQSGAWKEEKKEWRKENKRGFWQGLKQGIKTVVIKLNPLVIAARNGLLAAMKLDIKKMASRLKWGYATLEQAKAKGISEERWKKSKEALAKVEKLFVDSAQGSPVALKSAILKGKSGNISGLGNPVALIGAAAVPLIVKIIDILKKAGLVNEDVDSEKVAAEIIAGKMPSNDDVTPFEGDDLDTGVAPPGEEDGGGTMKALLIGGGVLAVLLITGAINKKPGTQKKTSGGLNGCKTARRPVRAIELK